MNSCIVARTSSAVVGVMLVLEEARKAMASCVTNASLISARVAGHDA